MMKTSSQTKMIVLVVFFVIFAGGMFLYGYNIMGNKNQIVSDEIAKQNVELEVLLREQKSFEQGKKDLAILAKSQFPPEELFSNDTKVVKEIQQLESAAQRYGLKLNIAVTGSVQAAKKVAGTASELYPIPYTMTLDGPINSIMQFIQATEKMPFASFAKNVSIIVGEEDKIRATIASEFYIKK